MAFTIADVEDLIRLLGEHPEWRERLRPVILGEEILQIPSRMDRVEAALEVLALRLDQLAIEMGHMNQTVANILARMDRMDGRMSNIEGELLESKFDRNMPNWVRDYVRRPMRLFVDEIDEISEALGNGVLSESDVARLASLDSLVRGVDTRDGSQSYLAVELSHTINAEDVERADTRAKLLNRAGLAARAFVGGYRVTSAAESMIEERGVLVTLHRPPA